MRSRSAASGSSPRERRPCVTACVNGRLTTSATAGERSSTASQVPPAVSSRGPTTCGRSDQCAAGGVQGRSANSSLTAAATTCHSRPGSTSMKTMHTLRIFARETRARKANLAQPAFRRPVWSMESSARPSYSSLGSDLLPHARRKGGTPVSSAEQTSELRFEPPGPGSYAQDPVHFPRPVTRYWTEVHPAAFAKGTADFARFYGMLIDGLADVVRQRLRLQPDAARSRGGDSAALRARGGGVRRQAVARAAARVGRDVQAGGDREAPRAPGGRPRRALRRRARRRTSAAAATTTPR